MTRKKTDKKMPRLEPQFHNVLVCKKTDCRPFLEVLVEKPENISRQSLGILAGIFQIDDRTEDSSYVVNYLISIIKKEYFSRTNRGTVENFEAALHKANLALAKLATHENVGWIGRINAICAVIEKNNLLISQTGNASAFLLRGATLMELTELPDESTDSNPLKTFQDVISGKIEKNDKLIITTKEIFDIFSLEELKKSALKFSRENFIQFLNTALINELDQVAALIVDIDEKIDELIDEPAPRKIEEVNVFSQTAFRKESSPKTLEKDKAKEEIAAKERKDLIREIKDDRVDFVDQKTGHIYIKEPENFPAENVPEKTTIDFSASLEKLSALAAISTKLLSKTGTGAKELSISIWEKSRAKVSEIRARKKAASLDALEKRMQTQITEEKEAKAPTATEPKPKTPDHESARSEIPTTPANNLPERRIAPETPIVTKSRPPLMGKISTTYSQLELGTKAKALSQKIKPGLEWSKERLADGLILLLQKPTRLTLKLTAILKNKWQERKTEKSARTTTPACNDATTSHERSVKDETDQGNAVTTNERVSENQSVTNIAPDADKIIPTDEIRYPWERTSSKPVARETTATRIIGEPQKRIAIPPILLKAVEIGQSLNLKKLLPNFSRLKQIVKNLDKKQKISASVILILLLVVPYLIVRWENKPKEKPAVVAETPIVALPLEKDLSVVRIEKLDKATTGNTTKILNLNNKFFALKDASVIDLENQKEFPLSTDFQAPDLFFGMDDLNLIFLIKNNKISSLSPTTGKFQDNNLAFPSNGKIVAAKTYLTYIYLLDTKNNQIYRAPRADGGFGEKTAWIRGNLDLANSKDLAINENVFVIDGSNVLKLFRGKKLDFSIVSTATPIIPDKLYAQNSGAAFYVLDKTNSRIIKLDNDGKILAQYYNAEIKNATDFSVSEDNNLAYISNKEGVKSFKLR